MTESKAEPRAKRLYCVTFETSALVYAESMDEAMGFTKEIVNDCVTVPDCSYVVEWKGGDPLPEGWDVSTLVYHSGKTEMSLQEAIWDLVGSPD
jgi:hypothetical protein